MAFVAVPGAAEVRVAWNAASSDFYNVLHYKYTAPITAGQLQELAQFVANTLRTDVLPHLSVATSLNEVRARSLEGEGTLEFTYNGSLPATGAKVGDVLPPQVALCYTVRTGLVGRSYRGRIYVGGWSEASQASGTIDATDADAIETAFSVLRLPGTAGTPILGVVSRQFNKVARTPPIISASTGVELRDYFADTQRRRARRG